MGWGLLDFVPLELGDNQKMRQPKLLGTQCIYDRRQQRLTLTLAHHTLLVHYWPSVRGSGRDTRRTPGGWRNQRNMAGAATTFGLS